MKLRRNLIYRIGLLLVPILLLAAVALSINSSAGRAQGQAACSGDAFVSESLPSGARWDLCWEHRPLEGVVLRDVYYTTVKGVRTHILAEAGLAQIHVPYDDNGGRFHDVTDDGLGDDNLLSLTSAECPDGRRLSDGSRLVLCLRILPRGPAFFGQDRRQGTLLSLMSVSVSGDYNYVSDWRFWDDGTIEPLMGASGKLQRYSTDPARGWPVRSNNVHGISHTHNYYWRLDFDLGEDGTDDRVEEMSWQGADGVRRLNVEQIQSEAGRTIDPASMRSWRIVDGSLTNEAGAPISYQLDPISLLHRDLGPAYEPWTLNDIYFTRYRECEKYSSHNPQFGGCGGDVTAFVDGESLVGGDHVLWYGVTFHHVPRDEDEPYMHMHWDGFRFTPRDWTAENEMVVNQIPVADFTAQLADEAYPLDIRLDAALSSDIDGEIIDYRWQTGDGGEAKGQSLTYEYPSAGTYSVTLTVSDDVGAIDSQVRSIEVSSPCLAGDVDCSGGVDVVDALFALQYDVGARLASRRVPPPSGSLFAPVCDVDSSAGCDAVDAFLLLQCSALVPNSFCPNPTDESSALMSDRRQEGIFERFELDESVRRAGSVTLHVDAQSASVLMAQLSLDGDGAKIEECLIGGAAQSLSLCRIDESGDGATLGLLMLDGNEDQSFPLHLTFSSEIGLTPTSLVFSIDIALDSALEPVEPVVSLLPAKIRSELFLPQIQMVR